MKPFKSIIEFQKHFNTEDKCRLYLEKQRWNGTPCCPFCGSTNVMRFSNNNKIFKCKEKQCYNKFSVLVGTVYENTKLPLVKWFYAIYILSIHSKGISSMQLANMLGITQKSAWFLNHRIREMLTDRNPELLNSIVEVDETLIGGKESNKHKAKRTSKGGQGKKVMVFGAIQRQGKLITKVVTDQSPENINKIINDNIEKDSTIMSDEHHYYNKLKLNFKHERINHRAKEYAKGNVYTNTIEGYWSQLKRQIDGIHHFVSPKHLQRYCNESNYRHNNRMLAQDERFAQSVSQCNGRLKYKQLIAKI